MKRLVILGGGESGVGTAILGKKQGWDVFVSDKGTIQDRYRNILDANEIAWEDGTHTELLILNADCIMKSPGIPDKVPIVVKAKEKNIPVVSELEFANDYTQGTIVGITGSNGKTTTTLLTHHLLTEGGLRAGLAGNIGYSFAQLVADDDMPYYVLEISSFQLDGIVKFAPHIAVIVNITPDHLDRYDYRFDNYIASKFRIAMNQTSSDYLIYDADDSVITGWLDKHPAKAKLIPFSLEKELNPGAYYKDQKIYIKIENQNMEIDVNTISLKGKHNVKNTMAASVASKLLNIRKESIRKSLQTFIGAPHRLEEVKTTSGIRYVNDSKATNVNSVYFALDSIQSPIVWIVGGVDKGNEYSSLLPFVHEKVKAIVCLGVDNEAILHSFGNIVGQIVETQSMSDAVAQATRLARRGDTVLLSPACASFDLFENYEDRGNQFKSEVEQL
ncbi:MAG: UDP-N-acetylmuramoyl-L-alanine--D-glutamate ligase [Capnocytophaga sp.]|nr:UDP-N-acetylmuramoyl-L-alanine--D-glutamate ligase [Capnocytophaga sp.]